MLRQTRIHRGSFTLLLTMFLCGPVFGDAKEAVVAQTASQPEVTSVKTKRTKTIVPVFCLSQQVLEAPAAEDPFSGNLGAEPLKDIVARLDQARDDDNVKAVVLSMEGASMGLAQREELFAAVSKIRESGKPVYAYADFLTFADLALLSSALRLSVAPVGHLFITGLYGAQPHLRGLLDEIRVTPDFLTCGDYKSAGEMYMRKEPSREAEEMYNWLFDGLFDTCIKMISDGRNRSESNVREWIDVGLYSAEKAAEVGIIDAAEHRHDMVEFIKQQHGEDIKFDKRYGKKKKSLDLSSPFAAFQIWAELLKGSQKLRPGKDAVAIVYVEGAIVPGSPEPSPFGSSGVAYSDPIRKALDKAAEDDSVKAVVLRVNSPGGSAVASEIILQATKRVAANKPFVVSMGDVAGSGGYYVACGAKTIFADSATITASIGVVSGKLATKEMWNSVGITWHPIQRGANADMMASDRVFTDGQREDLQNWMDEVYAVFKGHVVAIRGDRLKKPIDEIAGGRVFTGRQALELGLVDRIGTLDDAIRFVADEADLQKGKYEIRVIPRVKNFAELILTELSGDKDDDDQLRVIPLSWRTLNIWQAAMPVLSELQPRHAASLRRALIQLEILQRESMSLAMPEFVFGEN